MRRGIQYYLLSILSLLVVVVEVQGVISTTAPLSVGTARGDITPPIGMRLCGTFQERLSTGIHDPLWVRATVFSQDQTTFAVVRCDLAMIAPAMAAQARTAIARTCDISPEDVLIHASETHNGPDYFGEFRDAFHERALARHGRDIAEPADCFEVISQQIARTVCHAQENLQTVRLAYGEGICSEIAFNRRYKMSDGSIGWNPGKRNPRIVAPAGPTDPRVPVLALFAKGEDSPTAIMTGFAMHLAILNDTQYSADYPFYLQRHLRRQVAENLHVHFLQAPCCEVNHIDVSHPNPQKGHTWANHVGQALAKAVIETLPKLQTSTAPSLAACAKRVSLKLRQFSPEEVAKQRRLWYGEKRDDVPFLELVHAATVTGIYDRHEGGPVSVLLQAFRFDADTALIGLPSEVSVEFGLMLQRQSPFRHTVIVQLSNDWLGYIPTRRIFEEGQYEAVVAKIEPGQGEYLVAEALTLLKELRRQ